MAKRRKPKYYVAQIGAQTSGNFNWSIPENPTPSIVNQTATGAADIYGNQYFKPDETGTPTTNNPNVVPIDHKGNRLFDQLARYGQKDLNPTFQALNAGMQTVTAIANQINEVKNRRNEKDQYLRAITPDYYENMEGYGLNANPIFTKYGGKTMKYQVGGGQPLAVNNTGAPNPNDLYYSANAELAYFKDKLNSKLKAKNPQAFQDYFKGLVDLRRAGDSTKASQYVQDTAYNEFLTPDEVRSTLGDSDYDRYLKSLQAVNTYNVQQGKQPLWGTEEGQNDVTKLNYGRRFASLQVVPSYSQTNTTRNTTYNRNYTYNPEKQQVDILESGDLSIRPSIFAPVTNNKMKTGGKTQAKSDLRKAIQLHEAHMTGKEPTNMKSQAKLMDYIEDAYSELRYGGIPKTYGLQKGGKALANVEAEQGEAFQTNDGQIAQVANDAPTHDQGGVFLPNVHRVLENTSNIRKDKTSKILKLTPADVEHATGAKVKGNMSHAEALVKADEYFEKERNKITKKIELAAKDRQELDKYANLSTTLNVDHFQKLPTKEVLFEQLFNNQEMVKAMNNIPTGGEAKNGGQITKAQIGAYKGSKTGKKTPAGNSDAFPETATSTFQDYLNDLNTKGFKYEGIGSNAELQQALYEYKLQHKEFDDLRNMWKEGMHQTGMAKAKQLGFIDDKGNFKPGVLDNEDNLRKLAELYPDNMLGPRTLRVNKGKKPPRIWTDEEIPAEEEALTPIQDLDTSITPATIKEQPRSRFNEPLRWYDVASPVNAYMAALEREPGNYNPMEFNQLRYKLLDPTAALQQNQADFNAGVQATQNISPNNPGAGMANIANLAAQKYAANNQVLGNYENQNAQIKNNEITYNTQVRDKNSAADQQARELFENKVLTSKAIQQEQKLTALDSLYKTIAENRALNRNGNLIMKFSRAFDQYGEYNGYQPIFTINPQLGIGTDAYNTTSPKTGAAGAAGGIQQLAQGKNYYNRKTGKTLYFDGKKLVERK